MGEHGLIWNGAHSHGNEEVGVPNIAKLVAVVPFQEDVIHLGGRVGRGTQVMIASS